MGAWPPGAAEFATGARTDGGRGRRNGSGPRASRSAAHRPAEAALRNLVAAVKICGTMKICGTLCIVYGAWRRARALVVRTVHRSGSCCEAGPGPGTAASC
ncbi:hypothetical protein HOK021_48900 [Streptomyces hygroscopicus]|nr:hypothetical protein HOK021_48900 [Streptomyces hygroscopicus]